MTKTDDETEKMTAVLQAFAPAIAEGLETAGLTEAVFVLAIYTSPRSAMTSNMDTEGSIQLLELLLDSMQGRPESGQVIGKGALFQ